MRAVLARWTAKKLVIKIQWRSTFFRSRISFAKTTAKTIQLSSGPAFQLKFSPFLWPSLYCNIFNIYCVVIISQISGHCDEKAHFHTGAAFSAALVFKLIATTSFGRNLGENLLHFIYSGDGKTASKNAFILLESAFSEGILLISNVMSKPSSYLSVCRDDGWNSEPMISKFSH